MGGRGSEFKFRDNGQDLDGILNKNKKKNDFWTYYGDVSKETETNLQNDLTKNLKILNIEVCASMDGMNKDLRDMTLKQIDGLRQKYASLLNGNFREEILKIRSFEMDQVSYKTGKHTKDLSTGAITDPITNQICVNGRVYFEKDVLSGMQKSSEKENWCVPVDEKNRDKHVITHEFGHFVENRIIEKRLQTDVKKYSEYISCGAVLETNKAKSPEEKEKAERFIQIRNEQAAKIGNEIIKLAVKKYGAKCEDDIVPSRYGRKDAFEWFAEVFAEANLHTNNKPISKAMNEFLEKEGKEL